STRSFSRPVEKSFSPARISRLWRSDPISPRPFEEALAERRLAERDIPVGARRHPFLEALGVEDGLQARLAVHLEERLGEAGGIFGRKADPRGEHAVVVVRRGPDGLHRSGRDQLAGADARPEGAPHRARVSLAVQDRPEYVDLAGPGVAVLSEVGVEAERLVVPPLDQPFPGQEVNREDRRVSAVTAPEGQPLSAEVRRLSDPAACPDDDLGPPREVGVAHRQWPALALAEVVALEVGEVRVPGDVDSPREQRGDLCLVAQEEHDLDRNPSVLAEVRPHALPDPDDLRNVSHCTDGDGLEHGALRTGGYRGETCR